MLPTARALILPLALLGCGDGVYADLDVGTMPVAVFSPANATRGGTTHCVNLFVPEGFTYWTSNLTPGVEDKVEGIRIELVLEGSCATYTTDETGTGGYCGILSEHPEYATQPGPGQVAECAILTVESTARTGEVGVWITFQHSGEEVPGKATLYVGDPSG